MPELEIHHINVSQGDSTLIINRDIVSLKKNIDDAILADNSLGPAPAKNEDYLPFAVKKKISLKDTVRKAVLIDAGDWGYGEDVAEYLKNLGVLKTDNFYTIATHYHTDHVDGFHAVFFKDFDNKKKVTDQTLNLPPKTAYDCGDLAKWDKTFTRDTYRAWINALVTKGKSSLQSVQANDVLKVLGKDSADVEINLRCVASNGTVSDNGSTTAIQVIAPNKSPDQNARSVVLVLEYSDFRYFFGGDSAGTGDKEGGNFGANEDVRLKKSFSSHPDTESSIRKALPLIYKKDDKRAKTVAGHICVHTANHHGSGSSNDVFLIEQMLPKVAICSSGIRPNFHWHPTQQFFNRTDATAGGTYSPKWQAPGDTASDNRTVDNTIAAYYVTEMAQDGRYGKTQYTRTLPKGKILGDIVVRPISAVVPANINGDNTIEIQVYGTGDGTGATYVKDIPLRDFEPVDGISIYPIGPFLHTCDKH